MENPQALFEYVIAVSRKMAEIRIPNVLYDYVIGEVMQLVGAEQGYLVLIDDQSQLNFKAMRQKMGEQILGGSEDQMSRSILQYVVQHKEPLVLGNALIDPRFAHAKSVTRHHLRSVMCVPLLVREQVIGAIYVENRSIEGRFRARDMGPLSLFANQAAVSIENALLYSTLEERVEQRTAELEEVNHRLEAILQQLIVSKREADVANQAKSAFLANMSHELRTPLNAIMGYAQILQRKENLTENGRSGLQTIYQSGKYLLMLIEDVLDLAKIEAGRLELHPHELHLPSFLDGVVTLMRMSAQQKGLHLQYQASEQLPEFVLADETRLRQVLLNLIGNAVKFTKQGSVLLTVTMLPAEQAQECTLKFEITDTGIGVSADKLEEIFYPFVQVKTANQPTKGTGLGLTISRQLVDLMSGKLEVVSREGYGSTFSFETTLPVIERKPDKQDARQTIIGYSGPRRHLLIVDDQPSNQVMLLRFLEPLGFIISFASDGQQALQAAGEKDLDLILMDLVLPDMTGLEVVDIIRHQEGLQQIPILVVSADVSEIVKKRCMAASCDGFLGKPIEMVELLDQLSQHLALEWLYTETLPENNELARFQERDQQVTIIPPDETILAHLLELARAGNWSRLHKEVTRLADHDETYLPFTQTILDHLEMLDMKQVRQFVAQYLPDPSD